MPFVLLGVALYFAFAPTLGEERRRQRFSPALYASTLAPAIGFYDRAFGPGAGSFYMVGLVGLVGFSLISAMAGARSSNFGALIVFALSGHIVVWVRIAMSVGTFLGARLGARMALWVVARLVRPLVVIVCCAMAIRLMASPGGPLALAWKYATGG